MERQAVEDDVVTSEGLLEHLLLAHLTSTHGSRRKADSLQY